MGQKFVFFAVDYSFSMHVHNRKKDILFPGEDPIRWQCNNSIRLNILIILPNKEHNLFKSTLQ